MSENVRSKFLMRSLNVSRDTFSESYPLKNQIVTFSDPDEPETPAAFIIATSPINHGFCHIVEIIHVYVKEAYRCRQLGSSLVNAIIDQSQLSAPNTKFLIRKPRRSTRFWERMGFSKVDTNVGYVVMTLGEIDAQLSNASVGEDVAEITATLKALVSILEHTGS